MVKKIFWCKIYAEKVSIPSVLFGRFQIWARQFGVAEKDILAYIMASQGRLGDNGTTKVEYLRARTTLDAALPKFLDFSREDD